MFHFPAKKIFIIRFFTWECALLAFVFIDFFLDFSKEDSVICSLSNKGRIFFAYSRSESIISLSRKSQYHALRRIRNHGQIDAVLQLESPCFSGLLDMFPKRFFRLIMLDLGNWMQMLQFIRALTLYGAVYKYHKLTMRTNHCIGAKEWYRRFNDMRKKDRVQLKISHVCKHLKYFP